jgi:hypothetical protein
MARLIKAVSVDRLLLDRGHERSEFEGGDWDPGFRVEQAGRRAVHVYWDGPDEAARLEAITAELRADDLHVVQTQQDRGGRRRLEVTRP